MLDHDLAPPACPLRLALPTPTFDPSLHSLQSSPLPSPLSHVNTVQESPLSSSYSNTSHNPYFPFQAPSHSDNLPPHHAPAQLPLQLHPSSPPTAQYGMARQQLDLSLLHSGFGPGHSASSPFGSEHQQHFQLGAGGDGASTRADPVPTSPSGHDAYPFYFYPPDSAASSSSIKHLAALRQQQSI